MATFADNITALRKKQNKKRQEVADDLGISRSSLEYYELRLILLIVLNQVKKCRFYAGL